MIGIGECNNPFYARNSTKPIVPNKDPKRRAFGNHAFITLVPMDTVADACAGPYSGYEDIDAYISSAIDTDCAYPEYNGNKSDIRICEGVTSTEIVSSSNLDNDLSNDRVKQFMESISFKNTKQDNVECSFPVLPNILEYNIFERNKEVSSYQEILAGASEMVKISQISHNSMTVKLVVFVANDVAGTSLNRFKSLGISHSMDNPIFFKTSQSLGDASGKFETPNCSRVIWLHQNRVFDLTISNHDINPEDLASRINKEILSNTKIKQIQSNIEVSKKEIVVGETVDLEINTNDGTRLYPISSSKEAIRLVGNTSNGGLKFAAFESGNFTLTLAHTEPESLQTRYIDTQIKIT